MINIEQIRAQFPALNQSVNEYALTYLDNAATTQKPQCVIDAMADYYQTHNANVHRGSHHLTALATTLFEQARETVAQFIGACSPDTVIWTRGATESINLVAQSYGRQQLSVNDEILVCENEHHANIVPWQLIAEQTGAKVIKVPITHNGEFDIDAFNSLLSKRCKIVAIAHITNVTGARQPIEQVITAAHQIGAKVLIDGAQGIVHEKVNVTELDADFYVFSGHKLYAPNGIGVLYAKPELLDTMPVWQGGGKMVDKVSFDTGTSFARAPAKFEAGTPNVAGAIGLATAINWYRQFDHHEVKQHIHQLQLNAQKALNAIDDIKLIGFQPDAGIISFVLPGVHHQDIATLLDQQAIAVREGHHCAHPLMDALGIKGTVRISFAIYNTQQDVDRLISSVKKAVDIL